MKKADRPSPAEYAGSTLEARESKAWFMRNAPDKYGGWFIVMWSPGYIAMAGDLFEITFTHSSLRNYVAAAYYLCGSEDRYLLSKSNRRRDEFDKEATTARILEDYACLNSDSISRDGAIQIRRKLLNEFISDIWDEEDSAADINEAFGENKEKLKEAMECSLQPDFAAEHITDGWELNVYDFEPICYTQLAALRAWGNLIIKEHEAKEAKKDADTAPEAVGLD